MEYRTKNIIRNTEYGIQNTACSVFRVRHSPRRGVATLPTVMVMGVMALAVAVGITASALSESQGSGQSSRALFYAESGARDALVRIARNKNFSTTTYPIYFGTNVTSCVSGDSDCANISVSSGNGTTTAKIATSTGIMKASQRTIVVNVWFADDNGAIATTTWSEVTN
jgi:Tfp pilus assembly protein PilV